MRRISSLLHVFVLLLAAPLSAQVIAAKHVQVELIARESSAVPGHDLILGIHFTLEKGWHIYGGIPETPASRLHFSGNFPLDSMPAKSNGLIRTDCRARLRSPITVTTTRSS